MEIIKNSTMDSWKNALSYILQNGEDFVDKDGRQCRETLNLTITIEDPEKDFETPIDIMQQFEWVYPSKEELESIMLSRENLAGYEFSYGPRMSNFKGKDQLNDFVIPLLKKDSTSRRAIVVLYDPSIDSNIISRNIPSLLYMHFKIRNGKLNLTGMIRSNDLFIGWPGNIYQMFIVQKYVSESLNIKTGSLTTISGSAHLFHEHFEMVEKILKK
ncbi:MAG: thymidylate synthase [Candidatus Woesearchaeota archaeon]